MVGIRESNGAFTPLMAVDERAAALAKTSQSELAKRDARAIQAGIKRYRVQRTPGAWLRGTAIALLVPPLPAKLTPLHFDYQGGLMEQSNASLQRGRQG